MRRPLIGLPGRRKQVAHVDGLHPALGELPIDLYFADYARCVYAAGGMPVYLPLDADAADWVHHLDGLVLTGGSDVGPERYGHDNHASTVEPERDEVEFVLYDTALDDEIPVLGICRGLQVINVHAGGSLTQDVPAHARWDLGPSVAAHSISIEPRSTLHALLGDDHDVNSLHHQAVDEIGDGLRVTAVADDGAVEAFEVDGADVVAVQWHPEMMRLHDPTFTWVVDAARRRAS